MTGEAAGQQLDLLGGTPRRGPRKAAGGSPPAAEAAASLPVARVAVDVPLPHLDRPFDYLVPAAMDADAVPGVRVRVRFAGQQVDGFLLERAESSEHGRRLASLQRVVSPEPVLAPEILELARAVADRYAGTLADVLRLAVPARHARVESEPAVARAALQSERPAPPTGSDPELVTAWADYPAGAGLVAALGAGRGARAVWTALPGTDWAPPMAAALAATAAAGKGALAVVPDARDLARLDAALVRVLGRGEHVALSADLGPAERYRRWLAVRRGSARVVIGTRAAMFAPVADLGLVAIWDDGDDLHAEPRAPYPHVREVLCLRAHARGAGALLGSYAASTEAAALLDTGWAQPVAADRELIRARAPRVRPAGEDADLARDPAARAARLPTLAWQTARDGLAAGPVLVQVPRRGYLPALACQGCRAPARCAACSGPLGLPGERRSPHCTWCGRSAEAWGCPHCGGPRLRARTVGTGRTAEELTRAFPGAEVRFSAGDATVLSVVPAAPCLVVATPGAEPVAEGGYAAALLLDGDALLARADLRAGEEALRRWANAAALVRSGGAVVVVAEPAAPAVQALLRWDPLTLARRELAERAELRFPPAVRLALLTGASDALAELLAVADLPEGTEVLGPVSAACAEPGVAAAQMRAVLRVPRARGGALAAALRAAAAQRSARKSAGAVRIRIDPAEIS